MLEYVIPSLDSMIASGRDSQLVWIALISVLSVGYLVARAVYLLYFHPLAAFPGPRKAALSTWWLYRIQTAGRAEQVFEKLHEKYNTHTLRIGPNELHLTDPQLYHTIYSQRHIFTKPSSFYAGFGVDSSVFGQVDPELHRPRRKKMNTFFSKASIRELQGIIIKQTSRLCDNFSKHKANGPIHIYQACRCLTVDLISELAFGQSFNTLENCTDSSLRGHFVETFDRLSEVLWTLIYFPTVRFIAKTLPPALAARVSPAAERSQNLLEAAGRTLAQFKSKQASGKTLEHEVVFDRLTGLSDSVLQEEAVGILVAGSDTTATTLSVALEQITRNPAIYRKLKQELSSAGLVTEGDYDLLGLEQLPYLSALVKESLRYAMPASGRLPRIVPTGIEPLISDGKEIPAGTIIGMSAYSMHFNEDIWGSDAREFSPERWLNDDAGQLEKYMVTFSKGARHCLGINLALAELHVGLAMLVNRFSFTLDETMVAADFTPLDCFVSYFPGTGVRMHVHESKEG